MLRHHKIFVFKTLALLFLLCLVTYGDTLTHQFMIDDRNFNNPGGNLCSVYHQLGDFFTKTFDQHYAPLNVLLNVSLFESFQKPFPFYLINLLLFYINCALLFVLVYLLSEDFMIALLTAIMFCIHPMTGDMLQHITFNILFVQTIFIELGLIFLYLYTKHQGGILYFFLSIFVVAIALLCHETTIFFPLYAAVLLFFSTDLGFKRIVKLTIPFCFLSLLLIALWLRLVNSSQHLEEIEILHASHFWESVANFSHVFFWYFSNLLVPRNIVFMCNMLPLTSLVGVWSALLLGFLVGCGLLIFCYFKKSLESLALVIFLIGFVYSFVASQSLFKDFGFWEFEPNWFYFSSIGFYLFVILVIFRLRKYTKKWLWVTLVVTIFASYFLSTIRDNAVARTEVGYAENWLREFPGNSIPREPMADFYRHHKDFVIPTYFIPDMLDEVDVYIKHGYPKRALELMGRISSSDITVAQRDALSYKTLTYYCKNGYHDQCWDSIHHIIDPQKAPYAYLKLSYMFYQLEANETAIILLKQCISLYPRYKEAYLLIGIIFANEEHYEESIDFWKKGLRLDPTDVRFASNIDKAMLMIQKKKVVQSHVEK